MRLIYCYIHNFRNIVDQEICFANDYIVKFANSELSIIHRKEDDSLNYLYGNSLVRNLTVIVGKTGSGKTNLLQLIGMDTFERLESQRKNKDSYFLLYQTDREYHFLVECIGIRIKGVNTQEPKDYGAITFSLNLRDKMFDSVKRLEETDHTNLCIINGFDRYAFADFPYDDEKTYEAFTNYGFLSRILSSYGKFSVSMECILLKKYIAQFPLNSVKSTVSFQLTTDNWKYELNTELDERLYKKYYWTWKDKEWEYVNKYSNAGERKAYKFPQNSTPKSRFIHDLMMDYAIYLRKWIEGFKDPIVDLPVDHKKLSVVKRINELCKFIDMHSDEWEMPSGLVWQVGDDIKDISNLLYKMDEKYFTEDTFTIPVVEIDNSEHSTMSELFERIEQYRPDDQGIFTKELLPFHWTNLSSGEYQFAKVWGQIEEYGVRMRLIRPGETYKTAKMPNMILLLDEPETYMHPEMCRRFVNTLGEILKDRPSYAQLQIILSTHSPFMLSDLLPQQIIKMDYDENGYCKILPFSENSSFGANIHTILADGFFLKYTIGEQARLFLQNKYAFLKGLQNRNGQLSDNDREELGRIGDFVPSIGDEMIRMIFERLLKSLNDTFRV